MSVKTLESIPADRAAIMERLVVLNLCKEATEIGVKMRAMPALARHGQRFLSEMLDIMCPEMEKQVQYCTIQSVARYRTTIGKFQATLCPWAVQILPLKGCMVPISKLVRLSIPMAMTDRCEGHVVRGAIGDFAEANGFSIICRFTQKGDTKFLAGSSALSRLEDLEDDQPGMHRVGHEEQKPTAETELAVVRANMASPLAFCRCLRMIYSMLKETAETYNQSSPQVEQARGIMAKKMGEPAPKAATEDVPAALGAQEHPISRAQERMNTSIARMLNRGASE